MKVTVIPIVIGALGTSTKGSMHGVKDLKIRRVETIQTRIVEIGQNTKKIPGALRRRTVNQTLEENHQLMLV